MGTTLKAIFMKRTLYIIFLFISFLSCNKKANTEKGQHSTAQLFYNGDILTMESDEPTYVEALVEQDGKIVYIGTQKEAEKKYFNAKKVNLQKHTLLPGFIDPHSHIGMVMNTMGQVNLNSPPVGEIRDIADLLQKLKKYKEENNIPDGEWIFGWGYDEGQLKEKRHPTKMEIDEVFPHHPVYLVHTSGHMGIANSRALNELEITANTPDPEGGTIIRIPNSQEPIGLVQETGIYPFMEKMLNILAKNQKNYFENAQQYYIQNGVTTAQDGMTDSNSIKFFQELADNGKLKIDLIALAGFTELEKNLNNPELKWKLYTNRFKVQGTKIIADGSPQGKTAYFSDPFLTPVPGCLEDCRGFPNLSQETLNILFLTAYKNNNQLFIHGNGDATIDMIIAAHEYANNKLNQKLNKDRRTIVIHSQFVRPDQLETYKEYNIEPSFFTNHTYFWGDVHLENLGKKRTNFLSPIVAADNLGLQYTNHSDDTVTPLDPLFSIWTAVNRISRNGETIGFNQKATPYQALKAITIHAAYEFFEEDNKGSLKVGKLADFVLLDQNPLKVNPMKIKDIKVLKTYKEGKNIYTK